MSLHMSDAELALQEALLQNEAAKVDLNRIAIETGQEDMEVVVSPED
jgi:hypothetical protein